MYIEGDVPYVSNGNNNGLGFGGDGIWALALLALLFGGGYGGGFGGFGRSGLGNGGSEVLGYELGKVATTNDVASGFNNSAVLSSLNDIKLNQANAINYNNQGFNGLNTSILTTGNNISSQIADCCCGVKSMILENRYLNERQTCDILRGQQDQTREILNYLTTEKIDTLNRKLATAEAAYDRCQNNAYLLNQLKPPVVPSYPVFQPYTSFAYPTGVTFGINGNNCNQFC